jgi:hypothetical protein
MPADNYDTGYDHGYFQTPSHVVAAGIGLPILDIVFVLLRFAARKKQRQPLRADDWLLVPATVCFSMHYSLSGLAIH